MRLTKTPANQRLAENRAAFLIAPHVKGGRRVWEHDAARSDFVPPSIVAAVGVVLFGALLGALGVAWILGA